MEQVINKSKPYQIPPSSTKDMRQYAEKDKNQHTVDILHRHIVFSTFTKILNDNPPKKIATLKSIKKMSWDTVKAMIGFYKLNGTRELSDEEIQELHDTLQEIKKN